MSYYESAEGMTISKARAMSNLESMKAYQQATKSTGRACFTATQSNMVIDYV